MVNLGKPPLPPNKPYHWPLNYLECVKDSNLDVHARVFKVVIKANDETKYSKIVNVFSFTFKNIVFDWCNNYMGDYPNCTFAKLLLTFNKWFKILKNDE
jgi:hypothetical protein